MPFKRIAFKQPLKRIGTPKTALNKYRIPLKKAFKKDRTPLNKAFKKDRTPLNSLEKV